MSRLDEELESLSLESSGSHTAARTDDDVKLLKQKVRERVWSLMEKKRLLKPYPVSCYNKIPNFINCQQAAERVTRLREFKTASCVKVNPSLAQMHLRFLTLFHKKKLLVPDPSLSGDFFYEIDPSRLGKPWQRKRASSKAGAKEYGRKVELHDDHHIDLYVVASVACHSNGVRLGKGKGYAELEWAILYEMGAVTKETVVLTTVHDEQVLVDDTLSQHLLQKHDLPVDIIVTPTRILNVQKKLRKPTHGVDWSLITQEHLDTIPVLNKLKNSYKASQR